MNTPDLLSLADVRRESGASEVALFGYGLEEPKPLRFFVIVPERGAFQVPRKALEHLQAGDLEYMARDLREHWNGGPLEEYLIRRERLFVHADDWNRRMADAVELAQAIERISVPLRLGFTPAEEVANSIARSVLGVADDPAERLTSKALNPRAIRFHEELTDWLSLILRLVNEGKLTLYDPGGMAYSGPFEEGYLAAGELAASNPLFVLPPSPDRTYPRRIWFEIFLPGHSLRTVMSAVGAATTAWYPDTPGAAADAALGVGAEPPARSLPWDLVPLERPNDLYRAYCDLARKWQAAGQPRYPRATDCIAAWRAEPPHGFVLEVSPDGDGVSYYGATAEKATKVSVSQFNDRIRNWIKVLG
jgi:hypothetical protein